jgi:hypothetical protein
MRLPIDTHGLRFLAVAPAERLVRFEEGKPREARQPRTNEHGEILHAVQLVVMGGGEADVIRVTVVGDPKVAEGQPVDVAGLTAFPWEMEGRSGVAFRAEKVLPQGGQPKPSS